MASAVAEKKRKYTKAVEVRRASFTPFVQSVDGVLGCEARAFVKRPLMSKFALGRPTGLRSHPNVLFYYGLFGTGWDKSPHTLIPIVPVLMMVYHVNTRRYFTVVEVHAYNSIHMVHPVMMHTMVN